MLPRKDNHLFRVPMDASGKVWRNNKILFNVKNAMLRNILKKAVRRA
jgi:hypothetical protein